MKVKSGIHFFLLMILGTFTGMSVAGIQVGATRVIFPSTDREAAIQVRNEGAEDIMIQSWVEAAPNQGGIETPFAITPSLARLGYKKQQTLRIFYQGKGLPDDRESVFWLSVQEIPQISQTENTLQVAFRQRLKLFFRPATLQGTPDEAANKVSWKLKKNASQTVLIANNTTGFYISLGGATVLADGRKYPAEFKMIAPFKSMEMNIKGFPRQFSGSAELSWESINDYGALIKHQATITL
ncbi:TPA: molecular chaperone [Klebsiella aerogenes]|nr:molecular chaperone [Klebsiella aerogenes]HDU3701952.1 molecular chaperone [Klebsiella aerogenes]HDU3712600.1 molecular chaperone [Klebsiella aerogenes]